MYTYSIICTYTYAHFVFLCFWAVLACKYVCILLAVFGSPACIRMYLSTTSIRLVHGCSHYTVERPHCVHTQGCPLFYWRCACAECCSPLVCEGVPVSRAYSVSWSLHGHSWPVPRDQGQGGPPGTHSRVSKWEWSWELELVCVCVYLKLWWWKQLGTGIW